RCATRRDGKSWPQAPPWYSPRAVSSRPCGSVRVMNGLMITVGTVGPMNAFSSYTGPPNASLLVTLAPRQTGPGWPGTMLKKVTPPVLSTFVWLVEIVEPRSNVTQLPRSTVASSDASMPPAESSPTFSSWGPNPFEGDGG